MTDSTDNPPVFPHTCNLNFAIASDVPLGLSMLDLFAGMALQGIISSNHEPDNWGYAERAQWAYANAEAMLVERARRQT